MDVHLGPLLGSHARQSGILKDTAVQETHDVKRRPNDTVILAEAECPWHRHVGGLKRVYDAIFAIDLVRCLGEQFPWGLLAHDELLPSRVGDLVRWVRLAIAKLQDSVSTV